MGNEKDTDGQIAPGDPPDYSQMDYFPINGRLIDYNIMGNYPDGSLDVDGNQTYAVNCEYIVTHHNVPIRGKSAHGTEYGSSPNQRIDVYADDKLGETFTAMRDEVAFLTKSRAQHLLNLDDWTKEQRVEYEKILLTTIRDVVERHPSFAEHYGSNFDINRLENLNDFDFDHPENFELDCEFFSIFKTCLAHEAEKKIFNEQNTNSDPNSWKKPMNYFVAPIGASHFESVQSLVSNENINGLRQRQETTEHQMGVTPTGILFEPNFGQNHPYKISYSGYSLDLLARGEPAIIDVTFSDGNKGITVYGHLEDSKNIQTAFNLPLRYFANFKFDPKLDKNTTNTIDGKYAMQFRDEGVPAPGYFVYQRQGYGPSTEYVTVAAQRLTPDGSVDINYNDQYQRENPHERTYNFSKKDGEDVKISIVPTSPEDPFYLLNRPIDATLYPADSPYPNPEQQPSGTLDAIRDNSQGIQNPAQNVTPEKTPSTAPVPNSEIKKTEPSTQKHDF